MTRPPRDLRPHRLVPLVAVWLVVLGAGLPACGGAQARETDETRPLPLKIVPAGVEEVHLLPAPSGPAAKPGDAGHVYRVVYRDGHMEHLTPDEFAALLYTEYSGRNRLFALLNITSPIGIAWVGLGFLGQLLFSGRMLVQWLASERRRRSVIPVAFWWMSLAGATLLMVYFVWRKDIVGVLGQATGWLIYLRNLRLIYRDRPTGPADAPPAVSS